MHDDLITQNMLYIKYTIYFMYGLAGIALFLGLFRPTRQITVKSIYYLFATLYRWNTRKKDFRPELIESLKKNGAISGHSIFTRDVSYHNSVIKYLDNIRFKNIWSAVINNPNLIISYFISLLGLYLSILLSEINNSNNDLPWIEMVLPIFQIIFALALIILPILYLNIYLRKHILSLPLEEYTRSINAVLTEKELHMFICFKIHRIANKSILKEKELGRELLENIYNPRAKNDSDGLLITDILLRQFPTNPIIRQRRSSRPKKWIIDTINGNYNFEEQEEGGLNMQIEVLRIEHLVNLLSSRAGLNQRLYTEHVLQFSPILYRFWNEKFHRNIFLAHQSAIAIRELKNKNTEELADLDRNNITIENHQNNIIRCCEEITSYIDRMRKILYYSTQNIAYYDLADEILEICASSSSSAIRGYFLTCLNKITNEYKLSRNPAGRKYIEASSAMNNSDYYISKIFYLERKLKYHNYCSIDYLINNCPNLIDIGRINENQLILRKYNDCNKNDFTRSVYTSIKDIDEELNTQYIIEKHFNYIHDSIFNYIKSARSKMLRGAINYIKDNLVDNKPNIFVTIGYSRSVRELIKDLSEYIKSRTNFQCRFLIIELNDVHSTYMKYHLGGSEINLHIISLNNFLELYEEEKITILLGGEAYYSNGSHNYILRNDSSNTIYNQLIQALSNTEYKTIFCVAEYKRLPKELINSIDNNNINENTSVYRLINNNESVKLFT